MLKFLCLTQDAWQRWRLSISFRSMKFSRASPSLLLQRTRHFQTMVVPLLNTAQSDHPSSGPSLRSYNVHLLTLPAVLSV